MEYNKIVIGIIAVVLIFVTFGLFHNDKKSDISNHGKDVVSNSRNSTLEQGPQVEIEKPFYDFGVVIFGDVEKHIFKINNRGNKSLKILKLSTSCGCTKAYMENDVKVIKPGQSANMVVTFDPAVHKDDTDLGELKRIIYLDTNDQNNPEKEAEIHANVVKQDKIKVIDVQAKKWSFSPNPIQVNFGDYVELKLTSSDVEHGFNLPEFGISEKIEPGKETLVKFVANKKGTFEFRCSVFCGAGHNRMRGKLIIK